MGQLADVLVAAAEDVVAALQGAGMLAALDQADLAGPGWLVLPPSPVFKLGGCARVGISAYAVAQSAGRRPAVHVLADLLDKGGAALGWPWATATYTDLPLINGQVAPAYLTSWTIDTT